MNTQTNTKTNWHQIQALVPPPGQDADFAACLEAFPRLRLAIDTPQSAPHHREGTVWVHTQMCINELLQMKAYQDLPRCDQEVVFLGLLLHDIAKCSTTVVDPESGRIGHPGHSRKGAVDARTALWDAGVPFTQRESICRLVQSHQYPMWALAGSRTGKSPEYLVRWLSWQLSLRMLAILAEADMRGRICDDAQTALDNIELFRMMASDEGCLDSPRRFADDHTRMNYFQGADVHPDFSLFQESGSHVTLMCGLPASGKNTWVEHNRKTLPVVSFDDAREELGLRHGKAEGVVAHHAIDKAKALLRAKAPFVWNATHLSSQMRQKSLDLCMRYGATVEIVYLEQPRAELLNRNDLRDTSLSNKTLLEMLHRWEVPTPAEAHTIQYEAA